mmetsp:Transcript_8277/g.9727  ORF Transcript_8277/g.9727 Transcript_8277/m.9727 type:complete len:122 (+) Transcript_8277:240-605(+)
MRREWQRYPAARNSYGALSAVSETPQSTVGTNHFDGGDTDNFKRENKQASPLNIQFLMQIIRKNILLRLIIVTNLTFHYLIKFKSRLVFNISSEFFNPRLNGPSFSFPPSRELRLDESIHS